jgi:hypothetical protein
MHQEIRHQNPEHEYRDNLQERLIREDLLIPRFHKSNFTHSLTINPSRDIIHQPQQNQDNFISSLTLMIESNLKNMSIRKLKKLPSDQRMKFCSIAEDFKKCTSIRTARHFNIHFEAIDYSLNETPYSPDSKPLIDQDFFQLKLRSKADKIARKLFKTTISNFHINASTPETISYDFKNAFRKNSFSNIRTDQDFLNRARRHLQD